MGNKDKVYIFDTTMRDGEQSPGASMSVEEKIQISRVFDDMGIDIIEAGFPITSPGDFEAVSAISKGLKNSIPCGLARAKKKDIDACYESLKFAKRFRIHTFISTSPVHMKHKLNMTDEQVIDAVKESVTYAKKFTDDVEWSCEDGTRTTLDFMCKTIELSSTPKQIAASGIRIDSDYLIFIIDNSGSMIEGGPWNRVMEEISSIVITFPNLKGFMIMNDTGKIIQGDNPWLTPTSTNRKSAIDSLKNIRTISNSNPIPAIELAINFYGRKYDNVGIFVIGDDIRESKDIDKRLLEINKINTKIDGSKYVRINALAFLTSRRIAKEILPSGKEDNIKYLTLMRELTLQNGGTLVVVD